MKYYRVIKDTFLWKAGAILKDQDRGHYIPIEDIWDVVEKCNEYISSTVIENPVNAQYFVRVYPDTLGGKLYRTKDQLTDIYVNAFK